jgi:very-short-patch-repair endonuclease
MRTSQPWRTNRARALRSRQTPAEQIMWSHLRNRRLGGYKFVRQAAVDPYFADFLCHEKMVVVEIDGGTHGTFDELVADHRRTNKIERQGYRVFRTHNVGVFENIHGVLETLLAFLEGESVEGGE